MLSLSTENLRAQLARGATELAGNGLPEAMGLAVLHGNGNVIAIVELDSATDLDLATLRTTTIRLCDSVTAVRIDGVLFFYPRHERGPRMVFYDRDGTWEAMCGNGLRCLTRYAADRGLIGVDADVVTDDGLKAVRARPGLVRVTLGRPREVCQVDQRRWFIYTGVPHLVVFLPDLAELERTDVPAAGALLRYDAELCQRLGHPEGVHVDFVVAGADRLHVRTYEVGVEDETLCCGTGVAAAAYLGWHSGRSALPVDAHTRGGVVEVDLRDGALQLSGEVGYLADAWLPAGAGER